MAIYKYAQNLKTSNDDAFDTKYSPGAAAPHAGIYRCVGCGWEIGIAIGHTLPPQNHHQHTGGSKVEWQLLVYAEHKN